MKEEVSDSEITEEEKKFIADFYEDKKPSDKVEIGVFKCADGSKYVGQFKKGRKEGQGITSFPDGSKYEGEYVNDKFEGQGVLTYSDGDVYNGWWKNGKE